MTLLGTPILDGFVCLMTAETLKGVLAPHPAMIHGEFKHSEKGMRVRR